jgi:hypothetical protein
MMEANGGFGVELGPHNRCAAPLPVGLSRLIPRHVTMQTKNMHDDVFGHLMGSPGGSILQSGAFGSFGWSTKDSTPVEQLNMASNSKDREGIR